ncbi:DUF4124 domain-containing protein [Shewanella gelidii]|uniref:DUF4124 domain-containing protein n=1 Tax=Shewanella gelidii TaxID=1642821 RepID=A0A917NFA8_9GAMM|nr:DUF4124 domain-containing protein [Shewanella gelidii]MCL1099365.1 DUF4124 domain-containing protein [Shewanella gelidii]GGI92340.1 hypothetical protein GCM10009332_32040 [Shewanella gelidii]
MFELIRSTKLKFASLLLVLFTAPTFATVIYTWVDENGVTHYSQQSPENIEATKLYSEDMEQALIGFVSPKVSKKSDEQLSTEELNAELIKRQDGDQAKSICASAKHSLQILTTHSKLNRQDPKSGKSIAMTEEERQAAIKENKERISLFCEK